MPKGPVTVGGSEFTRDIKSSILQKRSVVCGGGGVCFGGGGGGGDGPQL